MFSSFAVNVLFDIVIASISTKSVEAHEDPKPTHLEDSLLHGYYVDHKKGAVVACTAE